MIKKILYMIPAVFVLMLGNLTNAFAQESNVEMADALRADGKIYVVVLVVMIVFTFLTIYLVLTDRQVKKLEKDVKSLGDNK